MTTPCEFLPPRSLPDADWIAALRSVLDRQSDIVAAYYLTTRYLDPTELQEELHLELAELPGEGGASRSTFARVADEVLGAPGMPMGRRHTIFTFPPAETLGRVREAGVLLWARGGG